MRTYNLRRCYTCGAQVNSNGFAWRAHKRKCSEARTRKLLVEARVLLQKRCMYCAGGVALESETLLHDAHRLDEQLWEKYAAMKFSDIPGSAKTFDETFPIGYFVPCALTQKERDFLEETKSYDYFRQPAPAGRASNSPRAG